MKTPILLSFIKFTFFAKSHKMRVFIKLLLLGLVFGNDHRGPDCPWVENSIYLLSFISLYYYLFITYWKSRYISRLEIWNWHWTALTTVWPIKSTVEIRVEITQIGATTVMRYSLIVWCTVHVEVNVQTAAMVAPAYSANVTIQKQVSNISSVRSVATVLFSEVILRTSSKTNTMRASFPVRLVTFCATEIVFASTQIIWSYVRVNQAVRMVVHVICINVPIQQLRLWQQQLHQLRRQKYWFWTLTTLSMCQ